MGFPTDRPAGQEEKLRQSLEARSQHVVHLTHNDLDAVGSDAIHRMRYGEVYTIFSSVGAFPHFLELVAALPGRGDLISISDLGYSEAIEKSLRRAAQNGWIVEWRDHHRWKGEEIRIVQGLVKFLAVDTTVCACGICARDLMPDDPCAAEIARVVCDYDLWKNQDKRSAVLGQVLQRKENREYVRDQLVNGIFSDGRIDEEYRSIRAEMEEMMAKSIRKATMREGKYRIVFAPLYGYPSETAALIREQLGSDIEVIISRNGRFSVRSVPPISHLVARTFRGGGHPHAAGGQFDFSFLDRLTYRLFRRSRFLDLFTAEAESAEAGKGDE